ncbi:MlaD family protein [Jongsikchunia kroppenstedtii]|uniref:MlaD family protein n=1 Tax=Jongsikchunia kroppenstedtii TaxID=1121721 RepID=UPI0003A501B7|nr:MlaD family protein [Jongsikchunia kroppenstedtii]
MADFRAAGMAEDPKVFLRRAVIFIVALAVVLALVLGINAAMGSDTLKISMRTQSVAGGIGPGSPVMLNGAPIGKVDKVSLVNGSDKRVVLAIDKSKVPDKSLLSSTLTASYAPWNLFGISSVILQTNPGGVKLTNNSTFYPDTPSDATLTTLLRQLSDTQNEAFAPHMGQVLQQANIVTTGLMPILGVLGEVLQSVTDTQRIPTEQTLPVLAATLSQANGMLGSLMESLRQFVNWPEPLRPGYTEEQNAAMNALSTDFVQQLIQLAGAPGLAQLTPTTPIFTDLFNRIRSTFPDATRNGEELQTLLQRIRAAMPNTPNGPVLNVDVIVRGAMGGAR